VYDWEPGFLFVGKLAQVQRVGRQKKSGGATPPVLKRTRRQLEKKPVCVVLLPFSRRLLEGTEVSERPVPSPVLGYIAQRI